MTDILTLENPLLSGHAPAARRIAQPRDGRTLPDGIRLVSADGHWEIAEDIFVQGFPAAMRDKAPRVWFDTYWHIGYPDRLPQDAASLATEARAKEILEVAVGEGAWDIERRTHDLDIEEIEQEILYPQSLLAFIRHPDLAVQEQVYRTYNEYISRIGDAHPGRYFGVGVCSNWWDPTRARDAIAQIVDLGLRTFMVPTSNPGKTADGKAISYGGEEMDTFWAEAERAGLPVAFHVGENFSTSGRGSVGATMLQSIGPFRKPLSEMIFGGVFDRHPALQVVFSEGGLGWVPPMLQDCEMIYDIHQDILDYIPQKRPSHYWHNNCHATFQNDLLGLRQIDYIGADRVMWAGDYPHSEGACGYSWDSVQSVIDTVGIEAARKILGDNARKLYRLED